ILAINNNKGFVPMYNSIVQQLIYLKIVVTGQEKDKIRLKELTMGLHAAKEFDASDTVFANRILSESFIAHKIRNGLKIKLPHEIESDYYKRQKKPRNEHPNDIQS
ncbi:immunity protein Tsi6 family protein, partial [Serratia quinivorans]